MFIKYRKVNESLVHPLPEYKTKGSSGMDIASSSKKKIIIPPNSSAFIPTNLILEIPEGYEGQIRPRSGLALNDSVTVLNSPGTIDSDYRGEIKVILINHSEKSFTVNFGDRIAQIIFSKIEKAVLTPAKKLSKTSRGKGGYGSTGK